jgi:hypothetical protein
MARLPIRKPSNAAFHLVILAFAAILGVQSTWILLAELSRPGIKHLPTEARAADAAAKWRGDAAWAALIGVVRGDLWAESAFTYSNLLWPNVATDRNPPPALPQARLRLERAIHDSPHQSDVWLLLAGLASRYSLANIDAAEALKMSYYTDPTDPDLAPLRLRVATQLEGLGDTDLQQFIGRDMRLLFARHQFPAVTEAHDVASPAGKRFIEETAKDIDPSALNFLRGHAP